MACAWSTDVQFNSVTYTTVCDVQCNRTLRAAHALTLAHSLCSYDLDFKNPDSAPESKITGAALADMYRMLFCYCIFVTLCACTAPSSRTTP